jgi:hypothetical protein
LASEEVIVFARKQPDGSLLSCMQVPDTAHVVAPLPALLRRGTISRHEVWLDAAGGGTIGEASGHGLMGKRLQEGTVKLVAKV